MPNYFSYSPYDGIEFHDTAEQAKARVVRELEYFADDAGDAGWDESVTQVCWGEIKQHVIKTNVRRPNPDNGEDDSFEYYCDYELGDEE